MFISVPHPSAWRGSGRMHQWQTRHPVVTAASPGSGVAMTRACPNKGEEMIPGAEVIYNHYGTPYEATIVDYDVGNRHFVLIVFKGEIGSTNYGVKNSYVAPVSRITIVNEDPYEVDE